MPASAPEVRPLAVAQDLSPQRLFAAVAERPGAVFIDSADSRRLSACSIIAFDPEDILTGPLSQLAGLRRWMERHACPQAPDTGFPLGGAIGYVTYEGEAVFGLYRRLLVYKHHPGEWYDIGGLAASLPDVGQSSRWPDGVALEPEPNTCEAGYRQGVAQALDHIAAGNIYQVNLARAYSCPWPEGAPAYPLYHCLREVSPAPYAAFLNLGGRRILSASPEQFLRFSGRAVQTRPIKGTRPRFPELERDERSAYDLLTSDKEIAELMMITDLERNDLGQICEFGSVQVSELLKLERYPQVFHLVSTVRGVLRPEVDHLAALTACFPGGSVTGTPKKRAREIIAELEHGPRGVFTGAIGYLGGNGESQFSIAIRTAEICRGRFQFQVGAGIVADSDPKLEYLETTYKALGILSAAEQLSKSGSANCWHNGELRQYLSNNGL